MKKNEIIHLIGCGVLAPDINYIAQKKGLNLKTNFLPGGLHNTPDVLRLRLQEAIDQAAADPRCCRIVVGYGVCGKGTIGIRAPRVPLVFPRVHDCIALFMGSDHAYRKEFEKYPGTFYISAGWYMEKEAPGKKAAEKIWVGSESMGCRELKDKYGEEGGGRIIDFFSSWHRNYQRAAFVDTGIGKNEKSAEHARKMAEKYNWKYESIAGNHSLLTRLLTEKVSDKEIVIIPPGHVTVFSALENGLDSAPDQESALPGNNKPRHLVYDDEKNQGLSISHGLGIDAGGTYTDAAVYDFDSKKIIDKNKALTTKWNFSIGIDEVLSGIDGDLLSRVELVSVSTTLATNAIVEGEGQKTGLILMINGGHVDDNLISHTPRCNVKGQINISGFEVEPVDEDEIRRNVRKMVDKDGVTAFAVSGFAGAVNPVHELVVKRIIEEETGMVACCGHELSDLLNFVVRAQTAVLNARIIPRMIKFFRELGYVLKKRNIHAPVMVVKGDGTLMSAEMAIQRPVETVLSGPAASVAGARLLTGLEEAMVVDMGGTTTDTADICRGDVDVCDKGADVGGFATHVKALDMRTVGLGGDSLIKWHQNEFVVGPRRVGPVVWANATHPLGIKSALQYMENHQLSRISQTLLVAMKGNFAFEPTPTEQKIYDLLRTRPHTPEELLPHLGMLAIQFLPLERLEESGLVQRCGLTPTDLLHVTGTFTKWDAAPAQAMVNLMSIFSKISQKELMDRLFQYMETALALELLKKQMAKDFAMDDMEKTPVFKKLMNRIINPDNSRYSVSATLHHPVIGIGAPVHYFLPQAGKRLNAQVIIPENADVANAVGAITSHIMIRRKLSIKTNSLGRFVVEGVRGTKQFMSIDKAEEWALAYLKNHVRELGRCAGTSRKTVAIDINDKVVNTGGGIPLFLGRTIVATLSGSPDRVLQAVNE